MSEECVAKVSPNFQIDNESSSVPAGYKQTEIGMIPKEWQVISLGEQASFIGSGKTNTKNRGEYPLFGSTGQIGSCKSPEYEGRAILVARVGANAGSLYVVSGHYGVSDNTIIIKLKKGSVDEFIRYWLTRENLNQLVFGSGQPLITGTQLKQLVLPLPPLKEQLLIAKALSDFDLLLNSLETLISKKQAIKMATMQQLLTGRTRLPQFAHREDGKPKGCKASELGEIPEDWNLVELREVSQFINGRAYALHEWRKSGTPVIRLQNLTGRGEDYYYSNLQLPENQYCHKGDLLFMWSATFGPIIWNGDKAIFHYHIWKIECKPGYIEKFLYFLLSDMTEKLKSGSSSGGTMLHVTKGTMESTLVAFPCSEEQKAIARILSSMDEEIDKLEERLSKTRQIKQGMMQELLSGKTRLI